MKDPSNLNQQEDLCETNFVYKDTPQHLHNCIACMCEKKDRANVYTVNLPLKHVQSAQITMAKVSRLYIELFLIKD